MNYHNFFVVTILLSTIHSMTERNKISAWQLYAEPLHFVKRNNEPVIIDMVIEWQLSMSYQDRLKHITLIDYVPSENESQRWYRRDGNVTATACNATFALEHDVPDDLVQLHGLHQRFIAINQQSPAKLIVVPFGAEVLLRVTNKLLTESISIHIHGLDKRGLWYTDGVPYVQQCPIGVNTKYTYRFIADTPGTHWLHGHMQVDRGAGLIGAFIVAQDDRRVVDASGNRLLPSREYALVLQDWSQQSSSDIRYQQIWKALKWQFGADNWSSCFAPTRIYDGTSQGGSVPMSALLVNSKGWHDQQMLINFPSKLPLETFQIKQGERILLRIINGGVGQQLMLAIEEHDLIVVAADGSPIKPITVNMIVIFPGERYDILIEGKMNNLKQHYYITLETLETYTWNWTLQQPYYGLAKLEYEDYAHVGGAAISTTPDFNHTNCSQINRCTVLNCPFAQFPPQYHYTCITADNIRSLNTITDNEIAAVTSDSEYEEYFINMHHGNYVNGWQYEQPTVMPYYDSLAINECDSIKCSDTNAFKPECKCFFYLNITLGRIVQFTFYNMGEAENTEGYTHAVHIHGTHFYLMKMGFGIYNDSGMLIANNADLPCGNGTICNNLQWSNTSWSHGRVPAMNTIDPSSRDTVILPAGGYVVLRFRATNPGWYYGHCHIVMHQMGGMAFALKVGNDKQIPKPPNNFPNKCGHTYEPNRL